MARTGRPREFDPDEVLARARDLFWSQGYATTSVQDLVDVLAVHRGSLYAAFGDKHSLYLKAVELYARENRERADAALRDGPVLGALRQMLVAPATLTRTGTDSRQGCLVGNTTAELVPADAEARTLVAAAYDGFIEVMTAALERAQASGEVTTESSPRAQAALLLLIFQGLALVSRAGGDRDRLIAGVDAALDGLRAR
jgi:TetR/AcrR family transcriptional repressor of nem operon